MSHNPAIANMFREVEKAKIKGSKGQIVFKLGELAIEITSRDIIGGAIQDWFGVWLDENIADVTRPENSQAFPDFVIGTKNLLEVKCFDATRGPAFDIANFGSYVDSLLITPQRLDASYIVFSYEMTKSRIKIQDIWLKKIWEISGPSPTNVMELQVKRGEPVNLRPKKWYSPNVKTFGSRKEFVEALNTAALKFNFPPSHNDQWLKKVTNGYQRNTGTTL